MRKNIKGGLSGRKLVIQNVNSNLPDTMRARNRKYVVK